MSDWYKLVCLNEGKEDWMEEELRQGRLRYGWSPPGSNLVALDKLSWPELEAMTIQGEDWQDSAAGIFRKGQFLMNKICVGDMVAVQLKRPLRDFHIFRVTEGYSYSEVEYNDFNHILKGVLLTDKPIPLFSKYLSNGLRNDLCKRGRYYQIYPEASIAELEGIVSAEVWKKDDVATEATHESELRKTDDETIGQVIQIIQKNWKSKHFEAFVTEILSGMDGVDVKTVADTHQGWDLTISIRDALTGEILHDDVPIQCKNYYGEVVTTKPMEDLERCIRNSPSTVDLAYVFILGDLSEGFYKAIETLELKLKTELMRNISFRVVDQERIARLYLETLRSHGEG